MRRQNRKLQLANTVLATSLVLGVAMIAGCPKNGPTDPDVPGGDGTNAEFQTRPPLVAEAGLIPVDGQPGKARLVVLLDPTERRVKDSFEFIDEDSGTDKKVLLRDDGKGDDRKGGDGLFEAIVDGNAESLRAEKMVEFRRLAQTEVPEFNVRVKVRSRQLDAPAAMERAIHPLIPRDKFVSLKPVFDITSIDPMRSLMITDLGVVEDPKRTFNPCTGVGNPIGEWTFGHLMTEMCNQSLTGIDPRIFVREWLAAWEKDLPVNGVNVPARINIRSLVIDPWEAASGGAGSPLDLKRAPFRLLAIVNRLDLRKNTLYGGGDAGEGRFVFGVLDTRNGGCNPTQFTVIFEYGVNIRGCKALKAYAQEWADLSPLVPGTPTYNSKLAAITKQFTASGAGGAKKPNQSALNQLRTNEIALDNPWELREFTLNRKARSGTGRMLGMDTVKLSPLNLNAPSATRPNHNGQPYLANFINTNPPMPPVPNDLTVGGSTMHFVGGSVFTHIPSQLPSPIGALDFWDGPKTPPSADIIPPAKRFDFSLNTCNGCHGGETSTLFTHVKPAPFGVPAGLSGFLTGIVGVPDPADGSPARDFNDLQRRQGDLATLLSSPCKSKLFFRPLRMVH